MTDTDHMDLWWLFLNGERASLYTYVNIIYNIINIYIIIYVIIYIYIYLVLHICAIAVSLLHSVPSSSLEGAHRHRDDGREGG